MNNTKATKKGCESDGLSFGFDGLSTEYDWVLGF